MNSSMTDAPRAAGDWLAEGIQSKKRKDGGAYRRMKNMIRLHAKEGKDRGKAKQKQK